MKAKVLDLTGKEKSEMELPMQFQEEYRPDVINRACLAERTKFYQPKGAYPLAGQQTSAAYYGRRHAWRQMINTGRSHLPREKIPGGRSGRVLIVPHAVKGRRAHPPKPSKKIVEKINLKEKNFAIRSAINASTQKELVSKRGHLFEGFLPLILDSSFEKVNKVKEAKKILEAIGLKADLEKAKAGRQLRSGRARLRKGGYKQPKTALIIIGEDKGVWKATRNIAGVDTVKVSELNADLLAPGGDAGRMVIWTQAAIEKLSKDGLFV